MRPSFISLYHKNLAGNIRAKKHVEPKIIGKNLQFSFFFVPDIAKDDQPYLILVY